MSESIPRKVFNLGFSKTGTTSIERALQILGYRVAKGHWKYNYCFYLMSLCIHGDYDEIISFTKAFDAFCDSPWGGGTDLYKRLAAVYPDARFILSIRDPEKWYQSLYSLLTIFDQNDRTALSSYRDNGMWGSAYWFRNIFGIDELHSQKQRMIDTYNRYNNEVICYFESKGIPLLVFEVRERDIWKKLCDFLGKDIPEVHFPKLNVSSSNWEAKRNQVQTAVASALNLDKPLSYTQSQPGYEIVAGK